jgi:hypothetical protein
VNQNKRAVKTVLGWAQRIKDAVTGDPFSASLREDEKKKLKD